MPIALLVLAVFTFLTAMPWTFVHLHVGRLVGTFFGPVLSFLILLSMAVCTPLISCLVLMKLRKNKREWIVVSSFVMSFLIMFSLSLVFMHQVSEAGKRIDIFIDENANLDFHDCVINASSFLNSNVHNAYKKPEAVFKIDNHIYGTCFGSYIMKIWRVTRADLIVYQGWGTCEQAAIVIEELLHNVGYETRQAYFKNINHKWAEVKYNGSWLIVDPWYIGNFVEIQNLKNVKPEFQQASGVWVLYDNGTVIDSSPEHGY